MGRVLCRDEFDDGLAVAGNDYGLAFFNQFDNSDSRDLASCTLNCMNE